LAISGINEGFGDWMDVTKDEEWCSPHFYELLREGSSSKCNFCTDVRRQAAVASKPLTRPRKKEHR
jgi:hypothetical protein